MAVLAAVLAATGYGRTGHAKARSAGSIEVFAVWTASEENAFLQVVDQFTKDTGINVTYVPTLSGFTTDIDARLAAGNPPDIAMLPSPGYLASLAKLGALKDLGTMGLTKSYLSQRYGPAWLRYGTVGGRLYGVPVKASSKSWIWYRPDQFKKYKFTIPMTWGQLLALSTAMKAKGLVPWAVGAAQSQWVLGDWVENIYARMFGPAKYRALFTGKLPFTDPSVTEAIRTMVEIINKRYVLGGIPGVLGSTWVDGVGDVFGTQAKAPKAQLYYEGGFVGAIALGQVNPKLVIGKTIDDFPWPTINPKWGSPVTIGADYAVAFKDSPEVKRFLQYITSADAAKIWVAGGAVIPNKLLPGSAYPNSLARKEGAQLASAKSVLFDGDDQMPGNFENTWCLGLQDAITNPSVANIKKIERDFQREIAGQWGK